VLIASSPKVFEHFAELPARTIERVQEGFARLGHTLKYEPTLSKLVRGRAVPWPVLGLYSGHVHIGGLPPFFSANGKGATAECCKASALAELAERYSLGVLHSYYADYAASRGLVSDDVVALGDHAKYLPGYITGHQRAITDAVRIEEFLEGEGFSDRDLATLADHPNARHWADAYSVTEDRMVKVPHVFSVRLSGSNGLASGNTVAEAVTHGACEVFERFTTWEVIRKRIELPTIALSSIKDPELQRVIQRFRAAGIAITIKDFSLGGRFPCIGVVFRNENLNEYDDAAAQPLRDHYGRTLKVGSAPTRKLALMRCFTEELQGNDEREYRFRGRAAPVWRYWREAMGREYRLMSDAWSAQTGMQREDFYRHGNIAFLERGKKVSFQSLWSWEHADCRDDVAELEAICRRERTRLLVVDTTHPVLGFPCVMVIIPRFSNINNIFENFKAGFFASGRTGWPQLRPRLELAAYEQNDEWLRTVEGRRGFIEHVEQYLTSFLEDYVFSPRHRLHPVDFYRLLAFAHLSIGNHEQATHYVELWRLFSELSKTRPACGPEPLLGTAHRRLGAAPKRTPASPCAGCTDPKTAKARCSCWRLPSSLEAIRLKRFIQTELAGGSLEETRAKLEALDIQTRNFVTQPPVNPLRYLWDTTALPPSEAELQQALRAEYERFAATRRGVRR
jgi:YcaO-like protein with predicted kinase domain